MMQCRNCGSQIPDGARYCPVCGADQTVNQQNGYALPQNDPQQQQYPPQQYPPQKGNVPPQNDPRLQPPYPPAPQPAVLTPKKKSKAPVIILAVIVGLIVLAVAAFVLFRFFAANPEPHEPTQSEETTAQTVPDPTTETDVTGSPAETTDSGTEVPKRDGVLAKYYPGNYVRHTMGDCILYETPDGNGENSFVAETAPGQLAEIVVTEVQKNPNAQSEYDLWRGKATVDGKTGWVDLFEWTCTDLRGTVLTPAEEEQVFQTLQGAWRYHSSDQLIEFAERENGERWVTATDNDLISSFCCEMLGTGIMYGDPKGLVRITLTTMQGYERDLLVDLTLTDPNDIPADPAQTRKREITWNFFDEGWNWSYYAGTSIEDAGPFGGGAY